MIPFSADLKFNNLAISAKSLLLSYAIIEQRYSKNWNFRKILVYPANQIPITTSILIIVCLLPTLSSPKLKARKQQ
jgi:hypothetical protein